MATAGAEIAEIGEIDGANRVQGFMAPGTEQC
jgi:hypothetical protein